MVRNSMKDAELLGKRRTAMRVPSSQENVSGKYLTDQPGESWVTVREPTLQDIQLGTGCEGTGHKGDEQSVASQAVCSSHHIHIQFSGGSRPPKEPRVVTKHAEQPGER